MRFERLPSTLNKVYPADHPDVVSQGDAGKELIGKPMPNTVDIKNNVRNAADTKKGENVIPVKISVPAERFEYKQYDTFDEFYAECGDAEKALEIVNEFKRNAATAAGKNAIRMATTGDEEQMIEAGLSICKNHSFKVEATVSVKEKAAKLDELTAMFAKGNPNDPEFQAEIMRRMMEVAKVG